MKLLDAFPNEISVIRGEKKNAFAFMKDHTMQTLSCVITVYIVYIYIDITTVYVITSGCIVHVVDYHICMLYMYTYLYI